MGSAAQGLETHTKYSPLLTEMEKQYGGRDRRWTEDGSYGWDCFSLFSFSVSTLFLCRSFKSVNYFWSTCLLHRSDQFFIFHLCLLDLAETEKSKAASVYVCVCVWTVRLLVFSSVVRPYSSTHTHNCRAALWCSLANLNQQCECVFQWETVVSFESAIRRQPRSNPQTSYLSVNNCLS